MSEVLAAAEIERMRREHRERDYHGQAICDWCSMEPAVYDVVPFPCDVVKLLNALKEMEIRCT